MFDHLVDLTEPICQSLDPALASMTIFDTSGIEAWVTENNPKYANRIIKQLKAFKSPITLMIPMILIKLLMALCQLMRLPIRQSSRCTSMDISVTPINLVLLRTGLVLFVTSLSTTRTF